MTTATNSVGTRREQVTVSRWQLEDIREQAQTCRNLTMAATQLLRSEVKTDKADPLRIEGVVSVTDAAWSNLETLLDMVEQVAPAGGVQ